MKVLSLFSGVGGFDLGLERAGMETVFQCEWDKHATKILERHWPHVPRWDDVSTLTGKHILQHAPVIDIVAWGSPCQDLSVAGKRAGLDGERSGLFHQGIRIIKELLEETNGRYPRISLWENVYGALNSNRGADFGVILDQMAEAGSLVQEWRVLDAQYFGVPQRRRRVFLISVFDPATAARCPDPLLPLRESVQWNPATSTTPRQDTSGTATASFGNSGFQQSRETDTAVTLSTRDHKGSMTMVVEPTRLLGSEIVGSLNAVDYKWPQNQQLDENKFVAVETFTKSKRAQTVDDDETWVEDQPAPTLNAFDQGDTRATTVIVGSLEARDYKGPNHEGARDGKLITEPMMLDGTRVGDIRFYEPPVQTLKERMGTGGNNVPMLAFDTQFGSNANVFEDQTPTLKASQAAPSVAYTLREREGKPGGGKRPLISEEKSGTLAARANDQTIFQPQPVDAAGFKANQGSKARSIGYQEGLSQTLTSNMPGLEPTILTPTMAVRRLTPIECERLMGWPDGWTDGQADTHRYKQCGNGVASPVAQWIAEQLLQLDKDTHAEETTQENPTT